MRISIVTFGCRLNQAEALDLEAQLGAAGHFILPIPKGSVSDAPDLIVVRGCSVTAKAQRDCEKAIAHLHVRFPSAQVVRTGCLPNATPLPRLLADIGIAAPSAAPVPLSTSRAYLKIQDGCGGNCAFCIVPTFRGKPVSTPFCDVIDRAKAFLAAGYRELVVTGCNLALYNDGDKRLSDLIDALANLTVTQLRHRIRLGSIEPGLCGAELLDAMERNDNICRFLHLSLQSASDPVLKRMNRPYRIADVAEFVAAARSRFGMTLCLGADVIAGFPGEEDKDFAATRSFLAGCDFCNVHAFPFSERPGTPAATMDDSVPTTIRRERANVLSQEAKERRRRFAELFAGREVEVCVERGGDHGWSGEYLSVRLAAPRTRRSLVNAQIAVAKDGTLHEATAQ